MRKLFYIILSVLAIASCSHGTTFSQQYTAVTTFEYTGIDYATTFGEDSTYFDAVNGIGLSWGNDLAFYHKVQVGGFFQGGFCLSYMKAAGLEEKAEDYKSSPYRVAGPKLAANKTYAVFYQSSDPAEMPEHDIAFLGKEYGSCTPKYCWVNNSETVYNALKKADSALKLTATGYLNKEKTGTAEIMLAADTTVYNWTKFDLSKLGSVDAIDFELITEDSSLPLFFCLDELAADIRIEY